MDDREHLATLLTVIEAASNSLYRPNCRGWIGDYQINGRRGHIITDGVSFYLYVTCNSKLAWTYAKKALSFATLTQDGDDEGMLRLDRLPDPEEAELIRRYCGIRKTQPPRPNSADHLPPPIGGT